jgi:hypothetical protein
VFTELSFSITCEVSREPGVEWFLTRESGNLPALCPGLCGVVEGLDDWTPKRSRCSVFGLKITGVGRQSVVMVVPLLASTLEWFEGMILESVLKHVLEGSWRAVVHICHFLVCKPPCLLGCGSRCNCPEADLWKQGGWRIVPLPELQMKGLPSWWSGVTDAIGGTGEDNVAWLRCPCGQHGGSSVEGV